MKKIIYTKIISLLIASATMFSCEQENYEPIMTAAPGGGTVTTYKAYTLSSTTGDNIYGRIVFYKYSSKVTLVQVGLYNTEATESYPVTIYSGDLATGGTEMLITLDNVDGATGAFGINKYFVISTDDFYENLGTYDASVKVKLSATTVAEGDIGSNAEPVVEM